MNLQALSQWSSSLAWKWHVVKKSQHTLSWRCKSTSKHQNFNIKVRTNSKVYSKACVNIIQCESKKNPPPTVFWNFFPNGWEFLIIFLRTYYVILYTLDYKFLFNYLQLWQSYPYKVWPPNEFLHFTRTLTSKFAYWANDIIVDVMSYPSCLFTL